MHAFSRPSVEINLKNSDTYQSLQPKIARNLSEAVGIVPIIRVNRVHALCDQHDFYLKLESCNPGGSIKEKNAVFLVKDAEERGLLKPGGTIVESSSGNFGIGLAMVGAAKGYRVVIVVDIKTPPPMRRLLLAYGAELSEVDATEADKNGSMQVARMKRAAELAQSIPNAWHPCQHLSPLNPQAHHLYTAREIMANFARPPDAIVLGLSTAGQLDGVGNYFKQFFPSVKLIAVDVAGSAILGAPAHPYKMTGLGLSFRPPNFRPEILEQAYAVGDELAFNLCRSLAQREGLLLGASTGAILAATLAYSARQSRRQSILMINPDRGDRYLETVYNDSWLKTQGINILNASALDEELSKLKPIKIPTSEARENHA